MNLLEKNIPYKSIIMRCDSINGEAYSEVSEFFSIENYHDGMKTIWADIQKMSGQFDGVSDDDIIIVGGAFKDFCEAAFCWVLMGIGVAASVTYFSQRENSGTANKE